MARIVFDLDGTLVGFDRRGQLSLNRPLVQVAQTRRAKGDTVILWTFGNRRWWRRVAARFPVLRTIFHEVYTKDELPGHVTHGRGIPEPVKDIRIIAGDVLVDNEPAHQEWAKRHGLAQQYILVRTYGAEVA